ncbi:MAG TPA: P22 phage major capsid protein family protein, partial [Longimicrobiales bacterium]|nr:P22 phage major capsid protein family protein [Longimicrobiales bacterium]
VTDGWASGTGVVATGDVFTMAGVYEVHPQTRISTGRLMQFVCNAGLTATGTAMTIPITPTIRASGVDQNVDAVPANDAALTFLGSAGVQYPQNLVGRPDGIALAMVDQDIEEWISAGNGAKQDYMGIRLATTKGPDTRNNQVLWRMDCIYGRVLVDLAQIVRYWG